MSEANETGTASEAAAEPTQPLLRVVKGDLTAEEIAALVAVVQARRAANVAPVKRPTRSEWGHPARLVTTAPRVGHDAWRRSAWAR